MSFFADYLEVKQLDNAESEHRMISKALIEQETKVLIRKYGRTREINIVAGINGAGKSTS